MDNSSPPPSKRVKVDLNELSKDELIKKIEKQQEDIEQLEKKLNSTKAEESDEKEKSQSSEASRRENVLVMRLANKEQEVQDFAAQLSLVKKTQDDAAILSLRQTNLDPGVNLLFGKMRGELQQTKDKLEQAQSELSAWKFTPDSQNGKKLMARCRTLIAENQDLGKQLSQGKSAQLEAELALQKKYNDEMKASQDELNEFVIQLDEEVEGMQTTIQVLQHQLSDAKEECKRLQDVVEELELRLASRSPVYERENSNKDSFENSPSTSQMSPDPLSLDRDDLLQEGELVSDVIDTLDSEENDVRTCDSAASLSKPYENTSATEDPVSGYRSPGTPLGETTLCSNPNSPGTPTEESMEYSRTYPSWDKNNEPGADALEVEFDDHPDIKAHIMPANPPRFDEEYIAEEICNEDGSAESDLENEKDADRERASENNHDPSSARTNANFSNERTPSDRSPPLDGELALDRNGAASDLHSDVIVKVKSKHSLAAQNGVV